MKQSGLNINRLRWISVIVPTLFVVVFELMTRGLFEGSIPSWGHAFVALIAVSAGAWAFSHFVFATVAKLEKEVRERNYRLGLLNALAMEVSESLDIAHVADATARKVVEALKASAAGLALTLDEGVLGGLHLIGQYGLDRKFDVDEAPRALGDDDCECRRAIALGRPVVVPDTSTSASCSGLPAEGANQTCVTVPVKSKGRTIGAVFVARDACRPFEEDEIDLVMAVGSQIGSLLENAQLFANAEAIAVLQERERVAREVHDGLAQTLGYLNVEMGIVDHLVKGGQLDKIEVEIEQMSKVTREAYEDLRQVITDLRVPFSPATSLRRTLREYLEEFNRRTSILCHFEGHHGLPIVLAPSVEVQVIRIVQEALTNVKKHALGCEVWLTVDATEREARVVVRDNGLGFDPEAVLAQRNQFGLRTMRERAESAGGKLTIRSAPGAGTTVSVIVPVRSGRGG